jgi:hypothetical protein
MEKTQNAYGTVPTVRVWARCGYGRVGICWVGEKNNSFFAETLPKLQFLWLFHLFCHHATLRVGLV